jgi:hypothetical protein
MKQVYMTTVKLLIEAGSEDLAADGVSAILTDTMQKYQPLSCLIDWAYEIEPFELEIEDDYEPDRCNFPGY